MRLWAITGRVSHVGRAAPGVNPRLNVADSSPVTWHADRMLLALALAAAAVLLTLSNTATGDYVVELRPSVEMLLAGDLSGFLAGAPVYGPSVAPRIPLMLAADRLGADAVGVYLAGAVACMLAAVALAHVLDGRLRVLGRARGVRVAAALTCVIAPLLTRATPMGHPEEILSGALCALALLACLAGRPGWAGVALGAAVAAKPWALIAVLPALLALRERRLLLLAAAGATGAAAALPFMLAEPAGIGGTASTLSSAPSYFHPTQIFWPLREAVVDPVSGATGYSGPELVHRFSHPLIVLLALPLSALFALRLRAGAVGATDALALLALLLFVRCLLDPWNTIYYVLPAILALVAWETLTRDALPVGAMALAALTWLTFVRLPQSLGPDELAAAYLAWALPAALLLARAAYFGRSAPRAASAGRQARTISATAARSSAGAT